MSKDYRDMSNEELLAELARLKPPHFDPAGQHEIALAELDTYREETRIQTEQLIEAQQQLEQSRDRYAELYESAPVAYFTLDHEGIIREINLTGARLFSRDRREIMDRPFVRFIAEEARRDWLDSFRRWNHGHAEELTCELALNTAQGPMAVEAIVRFDHDDGPQIYRVALIDLSAVKAAEHEIRELNASLEARVRERTAELEAANADLRSADRRKNEFLAMLGHELRNPLASISNGLALLKVDGLSEADRLEARRIMERQLSNMAALLNDLLDVSRVTLGKITLHHKPCDVVEIAASAAQACLSLIESRKHRLQVNLPHTACIANCDRTRVEQMIVNLLHNATKYTDPSGEIRLNVQPEGTEIRIDVIDSGCGMTGEVRERAFELFSQADSTIDRAAGGLGIGLTMVKSLAEMHGGRVEAFSDGPGHGSRFTIWLPTCNTEEGTDFMSAHDGSSATERNGLHVVIVEDNLDSAHLLKLLLGKWGHQVELAHTGVEGRDLIRRVRPDLALIDLGLPELDGLALARELRQEFGPRQLRLFAMTGYGSDNDREQTKAAGFDQHLVKPVSPEQLKEAINSVHHE